METKNIWNRLLAIQSELKCGKKQYNEFGKYYFRNCEDILEAVKPLCKENGVVIYLTDEIEMTGDRIYVKSTATAVNVDKPEEQVESVGYAREELDKKGMDSSQITGATSSYARKYALNGLLDIDDNKDSDTTNDGTGKPESKPTKAPTPAPATVKKTTTVELKADAMVGFGKYKDKTWKQVFEENQSYFGYVMENAKDKALAEAVGKLYETLLKESNSTTVKVEPKDDFKTIDTDYVDNFEQVLIQERNTNE